MQNSNVKGHIVESGIFLVGYMVSSLVVLWGIGFGRLHQHGDTIVTYSILFGTLETLKILLTGKILRVVLFFTNVFTGYYLMAFIDIIRRRCSIHDISPLNTGTYELVLLLGIVLSGFSYILLLIKHLHTRNGDLKWRKNIRRTKKRVSEIERERLRRMEERMHGPVDREGVTVDEEVVEPAATGEVVMNIRKAIEKFSGHKYITADAATDQQEFRCDNFVEAVLDDAGHNPQDYMSGKSTEKNVQNHIENALAKGRTSKNARFNAPNLPNGAYVVYMNESSKGYDPHAGIIIIDADSVVYTDNSSGNVNKGVSSTRYNSVQAFQSDYGYSNFYYQKIE